LLASLAIYFAQRLPKSQRAAAVRGGRRYQRTVGNTGYTPLHAAVFEGNAALVEALLEAGADQRVRCRDGKLARDLIAESRNDIARLFGRFPAP